MIWSVFLWYEDLHKENPELVFFTILRVAFGVTCSPFSLNGTIIVLISNSLSVTQILKNLFANLHAIYVDHSSGSFDDVEDVYSFYKRAKSILALA